MKGGKEMKRLNELNEFKAFLRKEEDLRKEKQKFLSRTIFTNSITLQKIPKNEKVLVKAIENALALNKQKCPWINLSILDSFLDSVYIFGREKDILHNLVRIVKMIVLRHECMIGHIGISSVPGRFSLKDFV